ncbi:MAG: thiol:disulfide interchange protein DsbA/DsbL [Gammaproteobacteria bacterium]|nr:thiol:disulfide interchange protein DsbA/DsbL [Gammaproteobacteria bacterium]
MKKITFLFSVIIGLMANPLIVSAAEPFVAGVDYELIRPAQAPMTEGKIEVTEVFSYGCIHCSRLEPLMERWLKNKPDDVEFIRMPTALGGERWKIYVRAYYTAEALGVLEQTHQAMFDAIHRLKEPLNSKELLQAFFANYGVDAKSFNRAFGKRSFSVNLNANRAIDLSSRYGIKSTPTLVVNGKYRITSSERGGQRAIFKVLDYLIAKEREAANL